jgi:hypothetical protein
MVVLHAFLALLAGFATMALLLAGFTALFKTFTPSWFSQTGTNEIQTNETGDTARARPGYMFVNLGSSFLAAAAGGYVTAWIAQHNPLVHVLALAIAVLALSALSVLQQQRGQHPISYMLALVAVTPIGVLVGGLVRLRVLGIL